MDDDHLESRLRSELRFQLTVHTNMAQWEAMDRLYPDDWENINATIRDVFAPFIHRYAYTKVVPALQQCRNTLCHVVWAAMNVPFPRDPFEHIECVVENTSNVLRISNLQHDMLMANHYAHVIQRNWRFVILNPEYEVCKRRLEHEYNELKNILPH